MRFGEGDFYPRGKKRRMWYVKLSQREKGRETERERERGREGERAAIGPRRKNQKGEKQNKKLLQKGPICLGTAIFVFDSWTSYGDEIMM